MIAKLAFLSSVIIRCVFALINFLNLKKWGSMYKSKVQINKQLNVIKETEQFLTFMYHVVRTKLGLAFESPVSYDKRTQKMHDVASLG